jgi:hypothetical protein
MESSTTSIRPWMTGGLFPWHRCQRRNDATTQRRSDAATKQCHTAASPVLPVNSTRSLTLFSAPSSIAFASSWNAVSQLVKTNDMAVTSDHQVLPTSSSASSSRPRPRPRSVRPLQWFGGGHSGPMIFAGACWERCGGHGSSAVEQSLAMAEWEMCSGNAYDARLGRQPKTGSETDAEVIAESIARLQKPCAGDACVRACIHASHARTLHTVGWGTSPCIMHHA